MLSFSNIFRLWHTLRHLRPVQIKGQIQHHLRAKTENPVSFREKFRHTDPPPVPLLKSGFEVLPPLHDQNTAATLKSGSFVFVHQGHALGWPPDWSAPGTSHLWQYNLHYHDWLWSLEFDDARAAALDWIEKHPLDKGAVGWEPYPTSLRLMNWTALFFGKWQEQTIENAELASALWNSMRLQAAWLADHLEYRLLGNHLLENACALALVGAAFDSTLARGWKEKGMDLLRGELKEQILPDGMHFERSPMYHCRIVHALLWLFATHDKDMVPLLDAPLTNALAALPHLTHPDGEIVLLNDAAIGVYPNPESLLKEADRLGLSVPGMNPSGPSALRDAGYYGMRHDNGDFLICDAAPIGPDYQPGHAHGDLLSFELSIVGERFFVDAGLFDYERGEMRQYCRSTRAHNTVEIEDADQCEFWGGFRVARRGYPRDVEFIENPGGFQLTAWHDGYTPLAGKPRHRRRFVYAPGSLTILDAVKAKKPVLATAYFHLHPDCHILTMDGQSVVVARGQTECGIDFSGPGELRRERGYYCPRFNLREETEVLAYEVIADQAKWQVAINW